jgi:hypothetical protein
MAVNITPVGDVYPAARGDTLGLLGSAGVETPGATGQSSIIAGPPRAMPAGHPLMWWVVLGALFLAVSYWAQHVGGDGDFKNPKVSAISILTVTGEWMVGWFFLRGVAIFLQNTYGQNGFSTLINGLAGGGGR